MNIDIKRKKASNFVRASLEALPFRNKVFDVGYCTHVLEHVSDLDAAVREIIRCCKRVEFRVPAFPFGLGCDEHLRHFDLAWFHNTFGRFCLTVKQRWLLGYGTCFREIFAVIDFG